MDSSDCPRSRERSREIEHPLGALAVSSQIVVRSRPLLLRPWRPPSSHEPACPTTHRLKITPPLPPDPSLHSIPGVNCPEERSGAEMARCEAIGRESPTLPSQKLAR